MPVVFALQPEGANPLSRSLTAGRQITLECPASMPSPSPIPYRQTSHGCRRALGRRSLDVTEAAIRAAIADLAGIGIYTDPASAASWLGIAWRSRRKRLRHMPKRYSCSLRQGSSGQMLWRGFPAGAVHSGDELKHRLAANANSTEHVSSLEGTRQPQLKRD